jgi:hypothetical protein
MQLLSLCLKEFGGPSLGGQTSTQTVESFILRINDTLSFKKRLVFILVYIAFSGLSHMTYCSETRDTKAAVRERVKGSRKV